jgi:hypothetical protein
MARDLFHNVVREALIKEGWSITHDPYPLHSRKDGGLSTDIGAEKIILAQNSSKKIPVEVKSFTHISILHEFLLIYRLGLIFFIFIFSLMLRFKILLKNSVISTKTLKGRKTNLKTFLNIIDIE